MRGAAGRATMVAIATVVAAAGCAAGLRIRDGVFHSPSGYRVTLPGAAWTVAEQSSAELELRHRGGGAGMLVNAVCEGRAARRSLDVLARHLLIGLRDRTVLASESVSVNGRVGTRAVVEGRPADGETRLRVEAYVLKDARCVYDLLYVAEPETFDALRPAFAGFVQSFTAE